MANTNTSYASCSAGAGAGATATTAIAWLAAGSVMGTLAALLVLEKKKNRELQQLRVRTVVSKTETKTKTKTEEEDNTDAMIAPPPTTTTTTTPHNCNHYCDCLSQKRQNLPELILLLRHGESESKADHTLWRTKPDNQIRLTDTGIQQSRDAGKRIEEIFASYPTPIRRVQIHASPFARTLQTAEAAVPFFGRDRVVTSLPESRIREQETGNGCSDSNSSSDGANYDQAEADRLRKDQQIVGRFWYRFPQGESGADVYDRVKSWWCESVLSTNEYEGNGNGNGNCHGNGNCDGNHETEHVDAIVVVTHSLSMRFVLMQLYGWSPHTFHSVWSSGECDTYVLRKDLASTKGLSPYVLDKERGDRPKSSVNLWVTTTTTTTPTTTTTTTTLKPKNHRNNNTDNSGNSGKGKMYVLHDYIDVPPPRRKNTAVLKQKLAEQYPDELEVESIDTISFEKVED